MKSTYDVLNMEETDNQRFSNSQIYEQGQYSNGNQPVKYP